MKRSTRRACAAILAVVLCAIACFVSVPASAQTVAEPLRYGQTTITDPQVAYVYARLAEELTKTTPPASVEISRDEGVTMDDVSQAFELFVADYPECFWLSTDYVCSHINGTVLSVNPEYAFVGAALTEAREDMEMAIADILIGLPESTNYDKALYLHDRLAEHVTYEMVGEHQTAYGALVAGKAVCAGYAAAYQLLLHRAGIDAWTVAGFSQKPGDTAPIGHAWNLVWIEDDVCVYTDVTWDDGETDTYHRYFNITKQEMAEDHDVDTALFVLPDCTHDGHSYFDQQNCTVTETTTMQELAALFGPAENGAREAVLYYEGANIDAFTDHVRQNQNDLYTALECGPGTCGYQMSLLSGEIHMTVTGNFPPMTYRVSLDLPAAIKAPTGTEQYVEIDRSMNAVTCIARTGYYFPEDYTVEASNGITVTREDFTRVTVSGTPTADTTVILPAPTAMQKEETPQASYTPTEDGAGLLSDLAPGMAYSMDGHTWIEIPEGNELPLTALSTEVLYIIRVGNGTTTLDSDPQILAVPNPLTPPEPETQAPSEQDTEPPAETLPLPGDEPDDSTPADTDGIPTESDAPGLSEDPGRPAAPDTQVDSDPDGSLKTDRDRLSFTFGCSSTLPLAGMATVCLAALLFVLRKRDRMTH